MLYTKEMIKELYGFDNVNDFVEDFMKRTGSQGYCVNYRPDISVRSDFVAVNMENVYRARIDKALDIAFRYSQIDGDHHKAWSIDQMVRALFGDTKKYIEWVAEYEDGGEYVWDPGITP